MHNELVTMYGLASTGTCIIEKGKLININESETSGWLTLVITLPVA